MRRAARRAGVETMLEGVAARVAVITVAVTPVYTG
jgi:hypothetical protein